MPRKLSDLEHQVYIASPEWDGLAELYESQDVLEYEELLKKFGREKLLESGAIFTAQDFFQNHRMESKSQR